MLQALSFDPCLLFVFRGGGCAVGARTTHIDDVPRRGNPNICSEARKYLGPTLRLKVQEQSFVHVGMAPSQAGDASVRLAQENFTDARTPSPTTPELRALRQRPLSMEQGRVCKYKLGKLCWPATDSRPDTCTRLAPLAARANSL